MAGEPSSGDGNGIETPREIHVADFVQCRALEMDDMMRSVSRTVSGGSRNVMQLLPRHMRRRAANHDVRRLPLKRRLAAHTDASESAKRKRRPSRRHRRRPRNLLTEYARRKRGNVWLETHIWHAKRFHMAECWGYKVPHYPNDRGVRAAYRDVISRCVMMDLSYHCCVELTGRQQYIINELSRMTSPQIGATFGAVLYMSGMRQGQTIVYQENSFPYHALAEVTFLWRPLPGSSRHGTGPSDPLRQLWIWTHPSGYEDVLSELKTVFRLTDAHCKSVPICGEGQTVKSGSRKRKMRGRKSSGSCAKRPKLSEGSPVGNVDDKTEENSAMSSYAAPVRVQRPLPDVTSTQSEEKPTEPLEKPTQSAEKPRMTLKSERTGSKNSRKQKRRASMSCGDKHLLSKTDPNRTVYENHDIRLESLKDELCRFRLMGPKSHQIVVQALRLVEISSSDENLQGDADDKSHWLRGSDSRLAEVPEQVASWSRVARVENAAELPPFSVHGLTVRDPRLFLPQHRTVVSRPASGDGDYPVIGSVETLVSSSAIWDRAIRQKVRLTKMSTAELNRQRANCLVPGSVPVLGGKESSIPVLLVQVPGSQNSCTQPSTPHRQMRGPALNFGSGWDIILPAGWSMAFWIALVYRGAKAVGLREQRSLAFESGDLMFPDSCPDTPSAARMSSSRADELRAAYSRRPPAKRSNYVKMGVAAPFHCPWSSLVGGWIRRTLTDIKKSDAECPFYCERSRKRLMLLNDVCHGGASSRPKSSDVTASLMSEPALVRVRLTMTDRGAPNQFALISLPTPTDLLANSPDRLRGEAAFPTERFRPGKTTELKVSDVVELTSRLTVGFLVEGGFSHATGRGCGVGFVSVQGLLKLAEQKRDRNNGIVVLVRSTNSSQYRLAQLCVAV